ncbi:hypothetical protein D3C81_1687080 [compost metagenome]
MVLKRKFPLIAAASGTGRDVPEFSFADVVQLKTSRDMQGIGVASGHPAQEPIGSCSRLGI